MAHLNQIASESALFDPAYQLKNAYHQIHGSAPGPIPGRYPVISDICVKIKVERDRIKAGVLLAENKHRFELEEALRVKDTQEAEAKAAKEAAKALKTAALAAKRKEKVKLIYA